MPTKEKKVLSKELREYKKKISGLDFDGKIKAIFDCSPYQDKYGNEKRLICVKSFNAEEMDEYTKKYLPILYAILERGDTLRAFSERCSILILYIEALFRTRRTAIYTGEYINNFLPDLKAVADDLEDVKAKERLYKAIREVQSYKGMYVPFELDENGTRFSVYTKDMELQLMQYVESLKFFLSIVKSYIESLKEFLNDLGVSHLLPIEFKNIETNMIYRFHNTEEQLSKLESEKVEDTRKYPRFFSRSEVEKAYFSINYSEIPCNMQIFGERNTWRKSYNEYFSC